MNILDYKINEEKLCELINLAEKRGYKEIEIHMNKETLKLLIAKCSPVEIELKALENGFNNKEYNHYYVGYKILCTDMEFGEVKLCGYKEKECSRITCYADGTPPKIETDIKDKVFAYME
jgi:hypothetical protein